MRYLFSIAIHQGVCLKTQMQYPVVVKQCRSQMADEKLQHKNVSLKNQTQLPYKYLVLKNL
jgi:hypothetical protein